MTNKSNRNGKHDIKDRDLPRIEHRELKRGSGARKRRLIVPEDLLHRRKMLLISKQTKNKTHTP